MAAGGWEHHGSPTIISPGVSIFTINSCQQAGNSPNKPEVWPQHFSRGCGPARPCSAHTAAFIHRVHGTTHTSLSSNKHCKKLNLMLCSISDQPSTDARNKCTVGRALQKESSPYCSGAAGTSSTCSPVEPNTGCSRRTTHKC